MEDKTDAQVMDAVEGSLSCRRQLPEDETFLWEVYASTRKEELELTDWSPQQRRIFVDSQFKAMRKGYASQFPQGEFSVIMLGAQPVGLMVVHRAETELRLVDIALLPQYRGRGYRQLLSKTTVVRIGARAKAHQAARIQRLTSLGFVRTAGICENRGGRSL